MKYHLFILLAGCVLSGCSSNTTHQASQAGAGSSSVAASTNFSSEYQGLLSRNANAQVQGGLDAHAGVPSRDINYYVRGLMQNLVTNLQYVNSSTPLAVASFVLLDGDYNETNLLGDQISESLIHEIHKFGIPVIDFKITDKISVTKQGDFIFSRDTKKLKSDLPIRYIVAGTLVKQQGGYLVNARIVGAVSKAVVASAQSYIPADVAGGILNGAAKRKSVVDAPVSIIQG